jgi:hypothetical protein
MNKEIDIDKELVPKAWEIIVKDGICYATITDAEIDPFKCTFIDDNVEIDFGDMTNIVLSEADLFALTDLINEAKEYYRNEQS